MPDFRQGCAPANALVLFGAMEYLLLFISTVTCMYP